MLDMGLYLPLVEEPKPPGGSDQVQHSVLAAEPEIELLITPRTQGFLGSISQSNLA
jgi:hypothetical protein